jgi:hypothetical protein
MPGREEHPMSEPNDRPQSRDLIERLVSAYDTMLGRVNDTLDRVEETGFPALRRSIDHARERAVELGELTREEADRVAAYLERDMKDAAQFLSQTGEELREWFRFDMSLIETKLFEMFANVADRTSLELAELADRARRADLYHTGEVTGLGTLACTGCGKELHYSKPGHIPPCSRCKGTEFRRVESS